MTLKIIIEFYVTVPVSLKLSQTVTDFCHVLLSGKEFDFIYMKYVSKIFGSN